jgi:deoxyadenosine/deoxycytidine kinase
MHIAIAGNIGSGKTTLTKLLAKHFNWTPHYEDVENNPYLHSQVIEIRNSGKTIVQDRTIYEDAYIFAPNLHSMNLMSTRDFENYSSLFELMSKFIQPPDLLIYLRASVPTLVNQIQKRNRDYEKSIRLDYLKHLNERYEAWISKYNIGKLLIIDVDEIDLEKPDDLGMVIEKINAEIHGLF